MPAHKESRAYKALEKLHGEVRIVETLPEASQYSTVQLPAFREYAVQSVIKPDPHFSNTHLLNDLIGNGVVVHGCRDGTILIHERIDDTPNALQRLEEIAPDVYRSRVSVAHSQSETRWQRHQQEGVGVEETDAALRILSEATGTHWVHDGGYYAEMPGDTSVELLQFRKRILEDIFGINSVSLNNGDSMGLRTPLLRLKLGSVDSDTIPRLKGLDKNTYLEGRKKLWIDKQCPPSEKDGYCLQIRT